MGQGAVRPGRPRREQAGKVEERILDAAGQVFLERGFEAASMDEIAEIAHAGKPTIYARFPGKQALFTSVIARKLHQNIFEIATPTDASIEERLGAIGTALLLKVLVPEWIALLRSTIAEARRFPELATAVSRMARERGTESVAQLLGEVARSETSLALPAFAADHLTTTTRRFLDLIVLPMLMRALFGEDLAALRAEIGPHVAHAVTFFLAACARG